jgi:TolA-binding protein
MCGKFINKVGAVKLVLSLVLLFQCGEVFAQDISTEATSVLLERTKDLLKADDPSALLPYLQEILVRVRGMNDKDSQETRSFCMYQIGVCKLQLERFPEAIEALDAFLNEFPNDSKVPMASLMVAEAYAMGKDWAGAEKYARTLMGKTNLDSERKMSAMQLLSEALYSQEKWKEAAVPLRQVFDAAEKPQDRNAAAIMLVTCFVKEKDFDNFLKFLAYCDDSVRQNAALNVALIEAGDQKLQEEDYPNALVLYRTVLKTAERLTLYKKQNATIEEALKEEYAALIGTTRSAFDVEQEKLRQKLEQNQKEIAEIQKGTGYDADLEMRIGQCYVGMKRNRPALTLYRRFYAERPDHKMADDARFQAFSVQLDMQDWDGAIAEAYDYLKHFPTGKFADEVSLNQMQVLLQNGKVDEAQTVGAEALKTLPNHRFIDQVKYLLGYINFQKIEYAQSLEIFKEVFEKWPDSIYHEASDYWIAMSYLFLGQFDPAITAFTGYLESNDYPQRRFEEDASYRLGIALYGAGRYDDAEMIFRRFIETFPGSNLESEALSMVGDLRGAEGDLEDAMVYYTKALEAAISIEQINYATFQSAKTLELLKRYQELIDMMEAYLAEHGEAGNFAGAGFWLGKSYKALGQNEKALEKYIETVVQFGDKTENADVDLILRELIKENEEEDGGWVNNKPVVDRLKSELSKARRKDQITLSLRLETLFAYITEGAERDQHVSSVLSGGRVKDAGPLTLLLMATEASARGNSKLVHDAYQQCMEVYAESEILVDVMNIELQTLFNEGEYDQVKALAEEITNRFGYRTEIGQTRMLKGDACRLTKDYDSAIKTYKELFAVREWRGPLTPQALYWIGVCTLEQGDAEEACAFFQRVYVMYEGHTEWVAKAYEGSILCLEKMGRTDDVIRTCREMLANDELASTPEGVNARAKLLKLAPQGEMK